MSIAFYNFPTIITGFKFLNIHLGCCKEMCQTLDVAVALIREDERGQLYEAYEGSYWAIPK